VSTRIEKPTSGPAPRGRISAPVAATLALVGVLLIFSASAAPANRLIPTPIGAGPRFHPSRSNPAVVRREEIAGVRCTSRREERFGVHVELFAHGLVVLVPAGIGYAPPLHAVRPQVLAGACSYAARTTTPTGVVEIVKGTTLTLGTFFDIWGQPFGPNRLAGFRARPGQRVRAYVDGTRWRGSVRAIPLRLHAEIVLELGPYIPPHESYLFGMGL
jgi:hypothetical protein